MKYANGRLQTRIAKVRVKLGQRCRHDHAFVADRDRRQARNIGFIVGNALLRPATGQKQLAIERAARQGTRRVDVDLLDSGKRCQGLVATGRRVNWHVPPADHLKPGIRDGRIDHLACSLGRRRVAAQEDSTRCKALVQLESELFTDGSQKGLGEFDQQAAAIAGLAVGGNSTTMRQARKRLDCCLHNPMARQIVEVGDQAEAATVSMLFRVKQVVC